MLTTIRILIACGFLSVIGYFGWSIYRGYRAATGNTWERLIAAAKDSATILWARFVAIIASVVGVIGDAGNLFGLPQVQPFVEQWLSNPKVIAAVLLGVSLITELARKRTL